MRISFHVRVCAFVYRYIVKFKYCLEYYDSSLDELVCADVLLETVCISYTEKYPSRD